MDISERPRGHKNAKKEVRIDASSLAIQETLKGFITQKEVFSSKREEREEIKRQNKEEAKVTFFELIKKNHDIEELNAQDRAMEAEAKKRVLDNEKKKMEMEITTMDMSTLTRKTKKWFERKKAELLEE